MKVYQKITTFLFCLFFILSPVAAILPPTEIPQTNIITDEKFNVTLAPVGNNTNTFKITGYRKDSDFINHTVKIRVVIKYLNKAKDNFLETNEECIYIYPGQNSNSININIPDYGNLYTMSDY